MILNSKVSVKYVLLKLQTLTTSDVIMLHMFV